MENANTQYAVELGQILAPPRYLDGAKHPFIVIPEGSVAIDLEKFLSQPIRIKDVRSFNDLASFIDYVNIFKADRTVIFADNTQPKIVALMDYHLPDNPSWCSHSAEYAPQLTNEWRTWAGKNNLVFTQSAFAEFIEDNIADVVSPSGAELLEIAQSLEAKKNLDFKSAVRLSDGTQELVFSESVQTKVHVPTEIKLGLSPFFNSPKYEVCARLRYRIVDNKLVFVYVLNRPQKVLEDAFARMLVEIEDKAMIKPFFGK